MNWHIGFSLPGLLVNEILCGMATPVQFELQTQFLRGQGASRQASAKLIEHVLQQKSQWLQEHQRMFQFDGFLKNQRRIDRSQRASSASARQLLKTNSFLSQAFTDGDFW